MDFLLSVPYPPHTHTIPTVKPLVISSFQEMFKNIPIFLAQPLGNCGGGDDDDDDSFIFIKSRLCLGMKLSFVS